MSESLVTCHRFLRLCLLNIVDVLRKHEVNMDFGGLAIILDDRIGVPNQVEIKDQV